MDKMYRPDTECLLDNDFHWQGVEVLEQGLQRAADVHSVRVEKNNILELLPL